MYFWTFRRCANCPNVRTRVLFLSTLLGDDKIHASRAYGRNPSPHARAMRGLKLASGARNWQMDYRTAKGTKAMLTRAHDTTVKVPAARQSCSFHLRVAHPCDLSNSAESCATLESSSIHGWPNPPGLLTIFRLDCARRKVAGEMPLALACS